MTKLTLACSMAASYSLDLVINSACLVCSCSFDNSSASFALPVTIYHTYKKCKHYIQTRHFWLFSIMQSPYTKTGMTIYVLDFSNSLAAEAALSNADESNL